MALVQGMRRIRDLALINVLGSLLGLLIGVPIVYAMGKGGVVPSLVGVAGAGIAVSWWYSQKIKVEPVSMKMKDVSAEISTLLKLGFVLMASGLMGMGVAYLVRIIVLRKMGEDAAGFYQAAWTLGGLYVAFILQAMGADFFPRLTAVANDRSECNRLVNEQAEVSLLLAGPGVIGTLTFAPLVIQLFYSAKFGPAVDILRWICLGMTFRVASWPMGFILLAKGARQPVLLDRVGRQRGCGLFDLGMCSWLWLGGHGDRLLRRIRFLLVLDLCGRARCEWISLERGEQADRANLCLDDCGGIYRLVFPSARGGGR